MCAALCKSIDGFRRTVQLRPIRCREHRDPSDPVSVLVAVACCNSVTASAAFCSRKYTRPNPLWACSRASVFVSANWSSVRAAGLGMVDNTSIACFS